MLRFNPLKATPGGGNKLFFAVQLPLKIGWFDILKVFTADGVCHGCLESGRDIFRPSDIHLSSDGLLYVSNYLHHCVKVFRILPPE